MRIPPNMTEEQVIEIMQKIAKAAAYKYRFGYFEADDIEQEAYIEAIKGLENYDGERPLENFLRVHVLNRLKNLKRNKFERLDKPCYDCPLKAYRKKDDECMAYDDKLECSFYSRWLTRNSAKKNLMCSIPMDGVAEGDEPSMYHEDDILDNLIINESLEIIEQNLGNAELRKDWIKLRNNLKIPKHRKQKIREEITRILEENGLGT